MKRSSTCWMRRCSSRSAQAVAASVRAFTARIRTEVRIDRTLLECSRGVDGAAPSLLPSSSSSIQSTRMQLALGAQEKLVALLAPGAASGIWAQGAEPLSMPDDLEQLLAAVSILTLPCTGGLRTLYHILSRPGFMILDVDASPDMDVFPSAPSEPQQRMAPFNKLSSLVKLLKVRAIQLHAEVRKLNAFLDARAQPYYQCFFPLPAPSEPATGAPAATSALDPPPPQLTLADGVELILAADCATPGDVQVHLRSLYTFGRSFLRTYVGIPSVDDGSATLWCLAHAVRLFSRAQSHRKEQGFADGGVEAQLADWIAPQASKGVGLFVAPLVGSSSSISVDTICRWSGLIVSHGGHSTARAAVYPRLASAGAPELLLFLQHFIRTRQHFASVQELEDNIVALAQQRGGIEAQIAHVLYTFATRFSLANGSAEQGVSGEATISPLLSALQSNPSTVSKVYVESLCGPDGVRILHRLQTLSDSGPQSESSPLLLSPIPSCSWQSVEEVIECMQQLVAVEDAAMEHATASAVVSGLHPLLRSHLNVTPWLKAEFVAILSNGDAARSPLLHPSLASSVSVADLEALYEQLCFFLPLPDLIRLPAMLWELATNLPLTVPTAGATSPADVTFKFRTLDQMFHALIDLYTLDATVESKRSPALPITHAAALEAVPTSAGGGAVSVSPETAQLLSSLESYLHASAGSLFTPELLASPGFTLNKSHASAVLRAAHVAHRRQQLAIQYALNASGLAGMDSSAGPSFELRDLTARMESLVREQALFLDFTSFIDAIEHFQYVPPQVHTLHAILTGSNSIGSNAAKSNGHGNAPSGTIAGSSSSSSSSLLLDASAAASLTYDNIFELIDTCDCTTSSDELLTLLKQLAASAAAAASSSNNSGSGASPAFDDFDSLLSAVRSILAISRSKHIEHQMMRAVMTKQLQQQREKQQHRENLSSTSPKGQRSRNRSRASDDLRSEQAAVATLTRALQRAASSLFYAASEAIEDDYSEEFAPKRSGASFADSIASNGDGVLRLLHVLGSNDPASASGLPGALSQALHFLHFLRHDYSHSSICATAYHCHDLPELQCKFEELRWRAIEVQRFLVRFVSTRDAKAAAKQRGAPGATANSIGQAEQMHDWTLLDSLFVGEGAPGLASAALAPAVSNVLPTFASLSSFVDTLRLLHTQSLDEWHAPALSSLWRSIMSLPPPAAVGSGLNAAAAAAAASKHAFIPNLIDLTSFEATIESMQGLWPDGQSHLHSSEEDVLWIRNGLQKLAEEQPRFASVDALLHAFRMRFFVQPHEYTVQALAILTHPTCALLQQPQQRPTAHSSSSSNAKRSAAIDLSRTNSTAAPAAVAATPFALNYVSVKRGLVEQAGARALPALERLQLQEDAYYSSLTDLASAVQNVDLTAPSTRVRAALSTSSPPGHTSLNRSSTTAASSSPAISAPHSHTASTPASTDDPIRVLLQAKEKELLQQQEHMLQQQKAALEQQQSLQLAQQLQQQHLQAELHTATALARREVELQERFVAERAALQQALEAERTKSAHIVMTVQGELAKLAALRAELAVKAQAPHAPHPVPVAPSSSVLTPSSASSSSIPAE